MKRASSETIAAIVESEKLRDGGMWFIAEARAKRDVHLLGVVMENMVVSEFGDQKHYWWSSMWSKQAQKRTSHITSMLLSEKWIFKRFDPQKIMQSSKQKDQYSDETMMI